MKLRFFLVYGSHSWNIRQEKDSILACIIALFFGTNLPRDGIVLEFETNLWGDGHVFLNLRYEMDEIVIINNLLFNKALKTKG